MSQGNGEGKQSQRRLGWRHLSLLCGLSDCLFLSPSFAVSFFALLSLSFALAWCIYVFCVSLCGGLWCVRISSPTIFIPFQRHSLYSLFSHASRSVLLSIRPAQRQRKTCCWAESCKSKCNTGDEGKGAGERVLHGFSWEPLWLVCGQLTCGSWTFRVLCLALSVFVFYHRGLLDSASNMTLKLYWWGSVVFTAAPRWTDRLIRLSWSDS